jgi:heat shock protein HslJ
MIKLRSVVASLAAVALTASLGAAVMAADDIDTQEPIGVFSIENMTWLLKSQMVDGELVDIPDRVTVSLLMEDGRAAGSGGCNSYFANYEMDGFDVTFSEVGSTLMACLPAVMDVEQAYFANLVNVVKYQSGGIQMAFLDADDNFILEFDLAPAVSVVGDWVATGINNQKGENAGVVSSDTTSLITAEFSPDGDLTGFDGCNDYFTTYVVEGNSISVAEGIGQTRMACTSDELAEQSQWYYGALLSATTWETDDASGALQLRDDNGSLQVAYAPAE